MPTPLFGLTIPTGTSLDNPETHVECAAAAALWNPQRRWRAALHSVDSPHGHRYSRSAVHLAIQMWMQIAAAGLALAIASADDDPATVAQLARQEARWAGPGGNDVLKDTSSTWFVISGDVRNTGSKPLAYVKLLFELVDDDGTALASEHGYNHRAEDLRLPDYEAGKIRRADLHIPPLQPGESDSFRMLFIRSEVPRFSGWRVRVLEVGRE